MGPAPRPRRRAVFLDRDGVLNRAEVRRGRPYPPASPEALEILPEAIEACTDLHQAGFLLVVVTNQPDIARGVQEPSVVDAMHRALRRRLYVDTIYVCPHDDPDGCACRKPRPGMLLAAADEHNVDLRSSYMVGDRWRDIEAGRRAGCRTILVDRGYDERRAEHPDAVVSDVGEAASWIRSTEA